MAWCKRASRPRRLAFERRIVGIDHHLVEEGIDRAFQRGERLQAGGVVALLEGLVRQRRDLGQRGGQRGLGGLPAAVRA